MNLINLLKKNSFKFKKKVCIESGNLNINYKQFYEIILKTTTFLKKKNIKKNDTLAVILENSLDIIILIFASSNIGNKIILLDDYYTDKFKKTLVQKLKVNAIISNKSNIEIFKNIKTKILIDKKNLLELTAQEKQSKIYNKKYLKEFLITFSSGSTADPKPIMFSEKTKIIRAKNMKTLFNLDSNDKLILACSANHSLGFRIIFTSIIYGLTLNLLDKFDIELFIKLVKKKKCTFPILIGSQVYELLKKKILLNKFKKGILSTSSVLPNYLKSKIINSGNKLFEMYGASEIGTVTSHCLNNNLNKISSVGNVASKNIKIKILSQKNKFLGPNHIGQIVCKHNFMFNNYFLNKKKTNNNLYKKYFKTGDYGYFDNDGFLYLKGRMKNIIKRSGINIFAEDIENILLQDKFIDEIVVGNKKKNNDNLLIFFIKKNKKINYRYIQNICLKKLSKFQYPNEIIFVKNFKKTNIGKIDRKKIN